MAYKTKFTLFLILILISVCSIGYIQRNRIWDDEYISFRYAKNVSEGNGWTFNTNTRINGNTNILYTLLLAGLGWMKFDIPTMGLWLSLFFLGGCGFLTFYLLNSQGFSLARYIAPFLIIFHPILDWCLGIETSLFLFLALLSIIFYLQKKYFLTTIILALTVLTRPDAILLAFVIFIHFCITYKKIPLRQIGIFLLFLLPWLIFSQITFGSIFPSTLHAKRIFPKFFFQPFYIRFIDWTITPMPLSFVEPLFLKKIVLWIFIILVLFGLLGFWFNQRKRKSNESKDVFLVILLFWGILHITAYVYLNILGRFRWHMAPLCLLYCILGGISLDLLFSFFKKSCYKISLTFVSVLGLIFLSSEINANYYIYLWSKKGTRYDSYYQAAQWIRTNTPANATIGASEVGIVGYFSNRTIIDGMGLVTPGVVKHLAKNEYGWFLSYYRPDYYIRFDPLIVGSDIPVEELWWRNAYSPVTTITLPNNDLKLVIYKKYNDKSIPTVKWD